MNMNLKLNLDLKTILPMLRTLQPYIFGLALIGVFGYTAWAVNETLNAKASTAPVAVGPKNPAPVKITFDKATIEAVKKLDVVGGEVSSGDLGKSDPFR